MHPTVRPLVSLGLIAFCIALAGCESSPRRERFSEGAGALPPVAMIGEAKFFDGSVRAEITISRGRPVIALAGAERRGGGGGGGRGHGRRRGGMGGGMPSDAGASAGDDEGGRAVERPVGMPPLTLRLKLENLSAQPQDVMIHDFTSDLGNFAVRPEHVAIAPGQAAEVDPMVSQLGAMADELPVTVVLRANGRTETQIVTVRNAPASAPAKTQ